MSLGEQDRRYYELSNRTENELLRKGMESFQYPDMVREDFYRLAE